MGVKELLPLGLILLGLAAGQYRVFENLSKHKASRYFTGIMFVLSVIAVWYQYGHVPADPFVNMILMNEDGTMDAASQFLKLVLLLDQLFQLSMSEH